FRGIAFEAEAAAQDEAFVLREVVEDGREFGAFAKEGDEQGVGIGRRVGDRVAELAPLLAGRGVKRDGMASDLLQLVDLLRRGAEGMGDLFDRWRATQLLGQPLLL